MATEPERYLAKARESLASARADMRARRYNSTANRAYYACFQAAVAALINEGIRPDARGGKQQDWEHRFVSSQFAGRLVWRRGIYPSELRDVLRELFETRLVADYRPADVSAATARRAAARAEAFFGFIERRVGRHMIGEPQAEYSVSVSTSAVAKTPRGHVNDVVRAIKSAFPDAEVRTYRRARRDYTIEVYRDVDETFLIPEEILELRADKHDFHDVWIVILPLPRLN